MTEYVGGTSLLADKALGYPSRLFSERRQVFYLACRNACHYAVAGHVFGDDGARSYHYVAADGDPARNHAVPANPYIIADCDGLGYRQPFAPPLRFERVPSSR